jgi:hypothetical protein
MQPTTRESTDTVQAAEDLPPSLAIHPLRVYCRAQESVALPAYSGSAVRGALFGAVRDLACVNPTAPSCMVCPLHRVCGASLLLATVDDGSPRGIEVPRPFVLRPPLDGPRVVGPGETFAFGITLIGDEALRLLPYLVLGLRRVGDVGLGRALPQADGALRRGRFAVEALTAINPFTGARRAVMRAGDALVTLPDVPVTHAQVAAWCAARGEVERVTLRLRTPLRLVVGGALVQEGGLTFAALLRRVCRRLTDLARAYAGVNSIDFRALLAGAAAVRVAEDRTTWVELESKSARQGRALPIGGLVGSITFAGPLTPYLPLLIWTELVGLGKDVTKGNGVIEVTIPAPV